MSQFVAPKCQLPGCPKRTVRRNRDEYTPYQLGADGKPYRLFCSSSCSSKRSRQGKWSDAKEAAMMKAVKASQDARKRKNLRELCELLKPFMDDQRNVHCKADDLAKVFHLCSVKARARGVAQGRLLERAHLASR